VTIADRNSSTAPARATPGFFALFASWLGALFSSRRVRPGQRRPTWGKPHWLVVGAVCALTAIAVAMIYLDSAAISRQRGLSGPVVLTFETITDFGRSGWLLLPLLTLLVILALLSSRSVDRPGRQILAAVAVRVGFLYMAIAVPGIVVAIVKRLIGRARPLHWETGGPFQFNPFDLRVEYASLPSGHGTTAFATAVAVGALFPRLRLPMLVFAALIALSRVVVSAHYPSDVIAGGCIGALGAIAVRNWFASRRLGFVVADDRTVRAMPGPSMRRLTAVGRRLVGR
jgi:membrane-associated phospholipid phosphatase